MSTHTESDTQSKPGPGTNHPFKVTVRSLAGHSDKVPVKPNDGWLCRRWPHLLLPRKGALSSISVWTSAGVLMWQPSQEFADSIRAGLSILLAEPGIDTRWLSSSTKFRCAYGADHPYQAGSDGREGYGERDNDG